ncbi:MAG: CGNR zinc finger domain-containing protein [Aestuariivirga sp.]|nr:CGNR zinc finger domain-containing protein [Aestuariivirga sp.]
MYGTDSKHFERRPGTLSLVAGKLALDFANTESGRGGAEHHDHLQTARDLVAWAAHAKIIADKDAPLARRIIKDQTKLACHLVARGRFLRETIYQINSNVVAGKPPAEKLLRRLTASHAEMLATATFVPHGDNYEWAWHPKAELVAAILGPITLSALDLLIDDDFSRIKQCQGNHCGWLFYDNTKNKSRQWCDMSVCGNRAKASALRARIRHENQVVN